MATPIDFSHFQVRPSQTVKPSSGAPAPQGGLIPRTIRLSPSMVKPVSQPSSTQSSENKSRDELFDGTTSERSRHATAYETSEEVAPKSNEISPPSLKTADAFEVSTLKQKLPAFITDGLMPAVLDKRVGGLMLGRASVLKGRQSSYLMSNSTDLSGAFGKLRVAIDMHNQQSRYVKVIRLIDRKPETPALTRAGKNQTNTIRDIRAAFKEAAVTLSVGGLTEFFHDTERLYLVMEYGQVPLPSLWPEGRSIRERQSVARMMALQLFDAVGFLHANNIVHNDIKHGNVTFDRNTGRLRLIDFGQHEEINASIAPSHIKHGTYPPPTRFAPEARGLGASPYDDLWGVATLILRTLSLKGNPKVDPFYFKIVHQMAHNASRLGRVNAFDQWFANMRTSHEWLYDTSLWSPAAQNETRNTVRALHRFGDAAYTVDPKLTELLFSHVFDLQHGPKSTAKGLAEKLRFQGDESQAAFLSPARVQEALIALLRDIKEQGTDDGPMLLRGLRAVAQDPLAQWAMSELQTSAKR